MIQDLPRMHHILTGLTLNEGQGHSDVKVTFFQSPISPEPFNQSTPNLLIMIALPLGYKIITSPTTSTEGQGHRNVSKIITFQFDISSKFQHLLRSYYWNTFGMTLTVVQGHIDFENPCSKYWNLFFLTFGWSTLKFSIKKSKTNPCVHCDARHKWWSEKNQTECS